MVASQEVRYLISQNLHSWAQRIVDTISLMWVTGSLPDRDPRSLKRQNPSLVWKIQEMRREFCSPVMIYRCCAWAFS